VLSSYRRTYPLLEDQVPLLMLLTDYLVMAAAQPTLLQFFPDKKVLQAVLLYSSSSLHFYCIEIEFL